VNEAYKGIIMYKLASREDGDGNLRNDEEKDESNPSSKLCFARSSLSHGQLDMEEEEEAAGRLCGHGEKKRKRGGSNSQQQEEIQRNKGPDRGTVTSCVVARGYNTRATSSMLFFPTGHRNSILSFRFCTHYLTSMFALHLTHISQ
jgi:hypothetical protein